MRTMTAVAVCLCFASVTVHAAGRITIGDYNAELRVGDYNPATWQGGRVDCELLTKRLKELGANTYYWLIWHSPTDWEDLHSFLPMAKAAGIEVWVYLVPHSESGPPYGYSEPFRTDYVRWAQEIAKLSLQHDNVVGYVIDDFWANVSPDRFSPEYIRTMVEAGKAINPRLKFYPLMYYPELGPHARFFTALTPLFDGVVAAYPSSREQIEATAAFLRGEDSFVLPAGLTISWPAATPSTPGQRAFVTQLARVTDPERASISFRYRDSYDGPTEGYHIIQLRVGGKVVWEEDTGGSDDGLARVDLSSVLAGRRSVRVELGVYEAKGVGNYPVEVTFTNLQVEGLRLPDGDLLSDAGWRERSRGAFVIERWRVDRTEKPKPLPLVVMPAGHRGEYEGRYAEAATSERIARWVKVCLELAREGKIEGVVTYCLDKTADNPDFDAVRDAIRLFGKHEDR